MIGYVTWFEALQNFALLAAPIAMYWGYTLRRRLHRYEDSQGNPHIISLNQVADQCPKCDGELQLARMEDDWGPSLRLSSARRVRSDAAPVFESHPLTLEESERLDWSRGLLQGAWCERCRQFFLVEEAS
jgi:hypothetical protein